MGGKSSAPSAPDPYATASAQAQANQSNSAFSAALNRMNTYTPTGSETYANNGVDPTTGAPIYSHSITLSPEQQQLYNQNTANQIQQSGFAGQALSGAQGSYHPMDTNYDAARQQAQDALYGRNTQYLDPQYARQDKAMDAKLAAQGIEPGSDAYKNAMDEYNASKNQAYEAARQDAISGATGQAGQNIQQSIALQNQPLNYYNALMSGNQASMPSFSQPGQINTSAPDVQGAINNSYQGRINSYNAQVGSANQNTSTLGSLLAMYLAA